MEGKGNKRERGRKGDGRRGDKRGGEGTRQEERT